MFILFDLCGQDGVRQVFAIVKELLNIARIIIPIGLTIMTIVDIIKKTINPDDKDGQKRIITRLMATIIVFFAPVMVRFVLKLVDVGGGNGASNPNSAAGYTSCAAVWNNAKL